MSRDGILYSAAAVLGVLTAIAAFESPGGAWPLCIGALACVALANIDRFSEISAGTDGIKATLRGVREEVDELSRRTASLTAASTLAMVQRTGRLGQYEHEEAQRILDETLALLAKAGVPQEKIEQIRAENWDRFVKFDYRHAALGGGTIPQNEDPVLRSEWKALRDFKRDVTPDELDAFLAKAGVVDGIHAELAGDFRHYCQSRTHRSPERWAARHKVPPLAKRLQ